MEDLARKLASDVEALSEYIRSTGGVQPSFDRSCPASVIPEDAPPEAQMARERIMEQCLKLLQLATGPSDYMINIQTNLRHFNILRLVPMKGAISYTGLANLAGCTETRLKNVVRMAMTTGLFLEQIPQQVSHSATSALFATSEDYRNWAAYATDVLTPVAAGMTEAHKRWPLATERTRTAYNIAFYHDVSFLDRLGQNPALHKQFAGHMRALATNQGTHMKHLVNGLEWDRNPNATVVDVGGSTGHSCIALAQAYPKLRFIVQNLPEVVEGGPKILADAPNAASIADRIRYQAHSFFEPNPAVGADFYLLRLVLHDWNAENCVRILRAIVLAMQANPNSNMVIMDCMFNSQERALEDWETILERADPRLKTATVSQPIGSVLALIKVELTE
ncbi:hydroxyindole O-methyltransferase [Apiospora aurea]|uniref:Hydroxyindole O-methyltransferase n=1 Tax=Apiospora aurea TaxID=335848 RepID=A0ABR1PU84_9PEZI